MGMGAIYKRKRIPKPKDALPALPKGKRGWLAQIVDPEGKDPSAGRKLQSRRVRATVNKRYLRVRVQRVLKGENKRKLAQMERLEWVTDKIRLGWSHRKIVFQFATQFQLSKDQSFKYIEKVYKDFQKQFSDPSKRTTLMAEHCAQLKEAASRAVQAEDFMAANVLMRQYAEVVGILVPPSMLKIHSEDNRKQVIIGGDEMKATLAALENLSERDLFTNAYRATHPQGDEQAHAGLLPVLDAETAVSLPDR